MARLLPPGFGRAALFIWLAENLGTYAAAWRYPFQRAGWQPVPLAKLGAWLLLMVISYVMVCALARPAEVASARQGRVGPGY